MFTRAKARKHFWALIVEKALAKQLLGYGSLVGGHAVEGLRVLTGRACIEVELKPRMLPDGSAPPPVDFDLLWARLDSFTDATFPIGASCSPDNVDAATKERCVCVCARG